MLFTFTIGALHLRDSAARKLPVPFDRLTINDLSGEFPDSATTVIRRFDFLEAPSPRHQVQGGPEVHAVPFYFGMW
jgi:hypothetical protein